MLGAGIAARRRTVICPVPCQWGLRLRRIEIGGALEGRAQGRWPPIEPIRRGCCQSHPRAGNAGPVARMLLAHRLCVGESGDGIFIRKYHGGTTLAGSQAHEKPTAECRADCEQ